MKRIKQFERTDRDNTNALLLLLEKNRFEKSLWLRLLKKPGSTVLPFINTSAINTRSLSVCRPNFKKTFSRFHL